MKTIISGRNMRVRDSIKEMVENRLSKFDKYFQDDIEAYVTFSHQRNDQIVEITIPLKHGVTFRTEERSLDMPLSIEMCIDKLEKQITKHKSRLETRYKGHDSIRFEAIPEVEEEEDQTPKIVKNKRFFMKPMDPEEAAMQMELLGHNFFVFLNSDTEEMNVVYARKDGKFGLIEPEI